MKEAKREWKLGAEEERVREAGGGEGGGGRKRGVSTFARAVAQRDV